MRTHAEIIEAAGGYKALADKLNKPRELCRFWARRGSIPPGVWPELSRLRLASLSELAKPKATS